MPIRFTPMPLAKAASLWDGASDDYGLKPELHVSDGDGIPCRHCLRQVAAGDPYLILAYRPFPELQPYAETGPIFLHAKPCEPYVPSPVLPPILSSAEYIVRGYGKDDRIVYGTGSVTPTEEIAARAEKLLSDNDVAYVHVRSARNNCYQCRIERA